MIEIKVDADGHLVAEHFIEGGADIRVRYMADSITDGGCRLITRVWTYPRMIHAEIMTHRALSRNAASSRAIPIKTLRERVQDLPAVPTHWGKNQKGMQADQELDEAGKMDAYWWWIRASKSAIAFHREGEELGLHKQIVNRVIEPWMMIETIVSSTEHANFFHLRKHKDAEPNFQALATLEWELFHNSMPTFIKPGGWHLPFVRNDDIEAAVSTEELIKLSVGRCARVSYLTHDGRRDREDDFALHDKMIKAAGDGSDPLHASPLEHPAQAMPWFPGHRGERKPRSRSGNFEGWLQYRKTFAHENGPDTSNRCDLCGCWADDHVVKCPSPNNPQSPLGRAFKSDRD